MATIAQALTSLRPGALWVAGSTYESIEWLDGTQTLPTKKEINRELIRLDKVYEYNEYQRLRAKAYPNIKDQMDVLYHQGYDGWKATVQAVKDQFPKPQISLEESLVGIYEELEKQELEEELAAQAAAEAAAIEAAAQEEAARLATIEFMEKFRLQRAAEEEKIRALIDQQSQESEPVAEDPQP